MKHFLQIADQDAASLASILDEAGRLRNELRANGRNRPVLARKTLATIFEKPSLRTRVSFEAGITQLGGAAINLQAGEIGLGSREPPRDVARVLGGMCDGIVARVHSHETVEELAAHSPVPVINGLSDLAHPCQALADLLTIRDEFGEVAGRRVTYVGDPNNVMRSLAVICGKFAMPFVACCPPGYAPSAADVQRLRAQTPQLDFMTATDPRLAVSAADVVYTDTWTSMGQEAQKDQRLHDFCGFTVDGALLAAAPAWAIVLHCLPANRGLEITDEVVEGTRSRIFQQTHNRLHAQKGLLMRLLGTSRARRPRYDGPTGA